MLTTFLMAASLVTWSDALKARDAEADPAKRRDTVVLMTGSGWLTTADRVREAFRRAAERSGAEVVWAVYDRPSDLSSDEIDALGKLPVEVYSYPAWFYVDGAGVPLAQSEGFESLSSEALSARVAALAKIRRDRDAAHAAASGLSGTAKADALGRMLAPVLDPVIDTYSELQREKYFNYNRRYVDEIRAADPSDSCGWVAKYTFGFAKLIESEIDRNCQEKKFDANERRVRELLANVRFRPIQRQFISLFRFKNAIAQNDIPGAVKVLDETIALAPKSHLATGCREVKRYYTEPLVIEGMRWRKDQNRPYWAKTTADVTALVRSAGTYRVRFVAKEASMKFRDVRLLRNGTVVAETKGETQDARLVVPEVRSSDTFSLAFEMRGASHWFGSTGDIAFEKEN